MTLEVEVIKRVGFIQDSNAPHSVISGTCSREGLAYERRTLLQSATPKSSP